MRGWLTRLSKTRAAAQRALGQIDALVQNAPIGIAFVDRNLTFVEINEALAAMHRRSVADTVGRSVDELPGIADTDIPDLIREVLRTGESKLDVPFYAGNVLVAAGYYPVRGLDGGITGVGILVREVAAERQRDLLLFRVTRLQELSAALADAGTVDDVIQTAVRSIQQSVGARAVSFTRLDGDTVNVEGSIGYDDEIAARWCSFPVAEDVPLAEAIRTGKPVLCGTRADLLARYPHLEHSIVWGSSTAAVALPLRGESSAIGAIGISFDNERVFHDDLVSFLVAATTQCATAFERALAFESERAARRVAEAANRRLEYLSSATVVLSESLDPETTMQRLAELAVPTLSEWCAVHLVVGEFAHPVAMASENPAVTERVRNLSERHPVPIADPAGLGAVVRTGEPIVLRSVSPDAVRATTEEGSELFDLLSRVRSMAIVPMMFQGRALGTIMLCNSSDRELADADVALASELAARAAQAITNAQLYQERNRVASTLQASLLPPSPALIPGVDVATRFVPAAEGLDVGGDFYDVFRTGTVDDPAPTWALVIGDVRGKGVDAAAITGIARATIRTAALDESSPSVMLRRLNQVLLAAAQDDRGAAATGEPRFCTACVITVKPNPAGADLVVAVGGHPLPYVVRADGDLQQVGAHGDLIGALASPSITDVAVTMGPGDALVLYTDGVTERHGGGAFFDDDGLFAVLDECTGATAVEIASRVELASTGFVNAKPKDDIAIVVARIPDVAAVGTIARRILPDDVHAAAIARSFVAETLRANDAAHLVETAVLLTSELATNAHLHGAPSVRIDVLSVRDGFRVSVTDEHPRPPAIRAIARDDEHGRGLVLVDRLASQWGVDARPPGKSVWFELRLD